MVLYPKARALRMVVRDVWNLPSEERFNYSGADWFLILLDQQNLTAREEIIFTFGELGT